VPDDNPSSTDSIGSGPAWAGYDELAVRHHESTADDWSTPWGDNPLQRHYSWPVTRDLLPDLDGERVLDAGCGVGDHVDWLLDCGATVTGIDASEQAVATASERFGDRATFQQAVLGEPLQLDDGAFDVALSHLVLDHVEDLAAAFDSLHRVLVDGGTLVFTVIHPVQLYLTFESVDRYYDQQALELGWEAPVQTYHRPVTDILTALSSAGFRLERALEPEPPDSYLPLANEEWQVEERPQILCVRATAGHRP
jgi:SAM-dependent methyltransferase